jgi:hypothetical protein
MTRATPILTPVTSKEQLEEALYKYLSGLETPEKEAQIARILKNISVTPSLDIVLKLALKHNIDPTLFQPKFVLIASKNHIRIFTYAFIGGPVCGPVLNKYTPFCLRLKTYAYDHKVHSVEKQVEKDSPGNNKITCFISYEIFGTSETTMAALLGKDHSAIQAELYSK